MRTARIEASIAIKRCLLVATALFASLILVSQGRAGLDIQLDDGSIKLAAGDYRWRPEVSPKGPVVVVVSLVEQRAYVYRNGIAIGVSTISSGREKFETPAGVFTILQKDRNHHSNRYDNAPMPYMQRLTWDGIAMHGGRLPGYPASHGCVRLPQAFAQRLFELSERGETVVVAGGTMTSAEIEHPAVLAPVTASGMKQPGGSGRDMEWHPEVSPAGPVSVLVSIADQRIDVLRNGVRIGSAPISVHKGFRLGGSMVFVMLEGDEDLPSPWMPLRKQHRWAVLRIGPMDPLLSLDLLASKLDVSAEFVANLYPLLIPGTSVLVTDLPSARGASVPSGMQPVLQSSDEMGATVP